MPQFHDLKIWPKFYQPIIDQKKTFEGRIDDRGYKEGDYLVLREYNPATKEYTGRKTVRGISYILHAADAHGLKDGYVILALELVGHEKSVIAQEAIIANNSTIQED